MIVGIKEFDVEMKVKNRGIEVDVSGNDGYHRGDLVITKAKLVWCKGKTPRENGVEISWDDFIEYMENR
jgi:hypothetical protein